MVKVARHAVGLRVRGPGAGRERPWLGFQRVSQIFDYVEGVYNPSRIQTRLGYRSPAEFETTTVAWKPCPPKRAKTNVLAPANAAEPGVERTAWRQRVCSGA